MTPELETTEEIFYYSFDDGKKIKDVEIPVRIPLDEDVAELVYRTLRNFKIPSFHYDGQFQRRVHLIFINNKANKMHFIHNMALEFQNCISQ